MRTLTEVYDIPKSFLAKQGLFISVLSEEPPLLQMMVTPKHLPTETDHKGPTPVLKLRALPRMNVLIDYVKSSPATARDRHSYCFKAGVRPAQIFEFKQ